MSRPESATTASTTHLFYDGCGWIEAVWVDAPEAESGYRWRFKIARDLVRWLRS